MHPLSDCIIEDVFFNDNYNINTEFHLYCDFYPT